MTRATVESIPWFRRLFGCQRCEGMRAAVIETVRGAMSVPCPHCQWEDLSWLV